MKQFDHLIFRTIEIQKNYSSRSRQSNTLTRISHTRLVLNNQNISALQKPIKPQTSIPQQPTYRYNTYYYDAENERQPSACSTTLSFSRGASGEGKKKRRKKNRAQHTGNIFARCATDVIARVRLSRRRTSAVRFTRELIFLRRRVHTHTYS